MVTINFDSLIHSEFCGLSIYSNSSMLCLENQYSREILACLIADVG